MKKILVKLCCLPLLFFPLLCQAGTFLNDDLSGKIKDFANSTANFGGYQASGAVSLGSIIASIVMGFYAILGIIFIILIILAGFKYLNARGDEQKAQEAIDQIRQAVIGLIIIVAAYAITYFVFNFLPWSGSGGGTTIQ